MCRFFLLLCCLLFPILAIHAQEPDSGWEIIERCVGEPTTPPDDWTFEGTILATGWAGIHGINADWDAPRVLHFMTEPLESGTHLEGTVITPNNEYIEIFRGGSSDYGFYASELVVSSLEDRSISRRFIYPGVNNPIRWRDSTEHYSGSINLFWWDDNHVGILDYLINIHTGEVSDLPVGFLFSTPITVSPDLTREVGVFSGAASWHGINVLDDENADRIYSDGVYQLDAVKWVSDSSQFVAIGRNKRITSERSIYIIDRNGLLLSTIFTSETDWQPSGSLAPSDSMYAFHFVENGLMIADLELEVIYDLCLDESIGLIWSPSSQQIALGHFTNGFSSIIFDLNVWQLYETDFYHDGRIIDWREDS